jgi:predicted metallopeptidase
MVMETIKLKLNPIMVMETIKLKLNPIMVMETIKQKLRKTENIKIKLYIIFRKNGKRKRKS